MLLGNGDGTFRPVNVIAGGQPISIDVADLNADGKLDLVTANWGLGTVGVLMGNGDGSFQAMQTYAADATTPRAVALADLNGDGNIDIAVGSYVDDYNPGSTAGILLGNGDGTFQPVVDYASGGWERTALDLADVNGDSIIDLIITSGCLPGDFNCAEGNIGILLGNGNGTFQSAVLYRSGGRFPQAITAVDVNADGRRDLVVANYGSGGDRGLVGVLLNLGADSQPLAITVSASPGSLWPPNGKMVPVTVSGTILDTAAGAVVVAPYTVEDEYGRVQPAGSIVPGPSGEYSFTVWLEASRVARDSDGRQYSISVSATDNAGNTGWNRTLVVVPREPGKRPPR